MRRKFKPQMPKTYWEKVILMGKLNRQRRGLDDKANQLLFGKKKAA